MGNDSAYKVLAAVGEKLAEAIKPDPELDRKNWELFAKMLRATRVSWDDGYDLPYEERSTAALVCEVMVLLESDTEELPSELISIINNRLTRIAENQGITKSAAEDQFFWYPLQLWQKFGMEEKETAGMVD